MRRGMVVELEEDGRGIRGSLGERHENSRGGEWSRRKRAEGGRARGGARHAKRRGSKKLERGAAACQQCTKTCGIRLHDSTSSTARSPAQHCLRCRFMLSLRAVHRLLLRALLLPRVLLETLPFGLIRADELRLLPVRRVRLLRLLPEALDLAGLLLRHELVQPWKG